MRWFLGESRRIEELLREYFAVLLSGVFHPHGEVWISDEPLGAALWARPGSWPPPTSAQIAKAPTLLRVFARRPLRALAGVRTVERGHPGPVHWYLAYLGVEDSGRGRGIGSSLMRPLLARCDAGDTAAYLNAGSPRSRDLYARHGFEVTERFQLPFGGPPMWRMWRPPAAERSSLPDPGEGRSIDSRSET